MKHITILVPDGQVNMGTLATITGVVEMFSEARAYWERHRGTGGHLVQTAGVSKQTPFRDGLVVLEPEMQLDNIHKTDLLIVPPSGIRNREDVSAGNRKMIRWVEQQYRQGAEVASMCSGIFMLAATGLLAGKICSAHWAHAPGFREAFPGVHLHEEKLITHEAGIYTNGGAYSFLNLALLLVENYYDRATAIYCAKMFQVEIDRQAQSSFAIFSGQKKHHDDTVLKAQQYIEANYTQKISIGELSERFATGRRNFDRRFLKATGLTPLDYLQRVKIEAAKRALENTRKTVSEVMYEVGYNDAKAFREVFVRVAGMTPIDYKDRYSQGR